ncbi:MAG TPA: T9SS type A sorting domain-containing protein [Lacibacter sp.]|nr:T9SS type A sorting domain-containing protein [Lacibacter sp.]HMO89075.1 T9SS type A sorting domain-containing protein [Lacibacter sp.]
MKRLFISCFLFFCFQSKHAPAQNIAGVINSYYKVTHVIPAQNGVRLNNVAGLSVGDRVIILQMKGAVIESSLSSSFGNVSSIGSAGLYEWGRICAFLNDTVVLEKALVHLYETGQAVQLVRVPVFSDVTVTGTLRAEEWNPVTETGGVLALEASGVITLHAGMSADSAGFKGGALFYNTTNRCGPRNGWAYTQTQASAPNLGGAPKGEGIARFVSGLAYGRGKQASGGGGANVDNTGGGGGGNYGGGGQGGNKANAGICNATTPGVGGLSLSGFGYMPGNTRVFMGGGGGCGEMNNIYNDPYPAGTPGGDGGGLLFVKCRELVGNGHRLSANGAQGVNPGLPVKTEAAGDGAGGGGAGGVVVLDVELFSGVLTIEANGAPGGNAGFQSQCPGPGGGGGGGVVWSRLVLPPGVSTSVAGGTAGIIKNAPAHDPPCELQPNGAVAGASGAVLSGYLPPEGVLDNCGAVLARGSLLHWSGQRVAEQVRLTWRWDKDHIPARVQLERKPVSGPARVIAGWEQSLTTDMNFLDSWQHPAAYRLIYHTADGRVFYSAYIQPAPLRPFNLQVHPNPADNQLFLALPMNVQANAVVRIFDVKGQLRLEEKLRLANRTTLVSVPVDALPPGLYIIEVQSNGMLYHSRFVRR